MPHVRLSLSSREGDRLGHLVRAAQMIDSYGKDCDIQSCSDVWEDALPDEPICMAVILEAQTANSEQNLRQLCQEVEWALGERGPQPGAPRHPPGAQMLGGEPAAISHQGNLACELLSYGAEPIRAGGRGLPPAVIAALEAGDAGARVRQVMPAHQFMALCRQGQRDGFGAAGVMGERPSGVSAPP